VLCALEGEEVDAIADFRGLGKRAPDLAFCLLIFLLSLAGIPPLAGFFGKFYVFTSALEGADHFGLLWLVLLALAMSVVSFYYYLRVLKQAYVSEGVVGEPVIRVAVTTRVAVWSAAALVLLLGCFPGLLLNKVAAAVTTALQR
jgi:NADH-quinone oxidoreductase subunit N